MFWYLLFVRPGRYEHQEETGNTVEVKDLIEDLREDE